MSAPAPRVALVTCASLPEPDPDEGPLADAVRAAGGDPAWVAWDGPEVDLAAFDLAVVRSTWNYPERVDAFARWLEAAAEATRLENPLPVLLRNLHKGYLVELAEAGVPVVPTRLVSRDPRAPEAAREAVGWALELARGRLVVKPAVGCASRGTRTFARADDAAAYVVALAREGDVVVQPFHDRVEDEGERCVVCLGGEPSHVVSKLPRFEGGVERASPPRAPLPFEAAAARRALARAGGPTLYGRVDLFPDGPWAAERPLVSELEVLDASLFLADAPDACARFARRLVDAARAAT